ncbi:septal ring lytic transglycosylase RlpA family protein [Desulfococcus sp.]|uniref:septal ring lytic transglycosylase RlpA family protein n=1 Tax=Desulfococcus sp. TaxID=2025834 RepID=UPI0035930FDD
MKRRMNLRPMPSVCAIIGLVVIGALTGCATSSKSPAVKRESDTGRIAAAKKAPATQRPYKINGIWYYPLASAHGYRQQGIASWYGKDFHGKKTSCGETYNMYGISAAHKTLPMGTHVEVRNMENGNAIRLTINDRGPFVAGRIIDLSYAAAQKIGVARPGTARVVVTAIGTSAPRRTPHRYDTLPDELDRGNFSIQVGAFGDRDKAMKLAQALNQTYKDAQVLPTYSPRNQQTLYRVVVGKCTSLKTAETYENALKSRGFRDAFAIAQ